MVDGGEDSILSCMFVFPIEGEILSNDRDRERYKRCDLHTSYIAKKKWNFFLQMMVSSLRMAVDGDIKSKLSTPTWTSKHLLLSDVTIKHLHAVLKRHYNAASWPFARKIVDYWESLLFFENNSIFPSETKQKSYVTQYTIKIQGFPSRLRRQKYCVAFKWENHGSLFCMLAKRKVAGFLFVLSENNSI